MCDAGFGWRQAFVRPALLMLGAAGALIARGKKYFLAQYIIIELRVRNLARKELYNLYYVK